MYVVGVIFCSLLFPFLNEFIADSNTVDMFLDSIFEVRR